MGSRGRRFRIHVPGLPSVEGTLGQKGGLRRSRKTVVEMVGSVV